MGIDSNNCWQFIVQNIFKAFSRILNLLLIILDYECKWENTGHKLEQRWFDGI